MTASKSEPPLRLLVIAGPTASGKTRLGVEVAHELGSEIVSADSRQVYRGLDIGSGKDLDEYRRVRPPVGYHLVDVADPATPYSVFCYQQDCFRLLEAKHAEPAYRGGRPLVMVGGTGLYIEAVLKGYRIANVPEDVSLRERLMERGQAELIRELRRIDPGLAGRTDTSSKKRVVRALEIADHATRAPVTYGAPLAVPIEPRVFVIEFDSTELARRIDLRLQQRLEQGLIEEVEGLLQAGLSRERMQQLGLEYREVTEFLLGTKSRQQMVDDLRLGIRRLAKRQRTWFRGLGRRGIAAETVSSHDPRVAARAALEAFEDRAP